MHLLRPFCAVFAFLALTHAEEVQVDRLTLKDGRILEGAYDKDAGTLDLSPTGAKAVLQVKSDDVVSVVQVTIAVHKADPKEKARRQLKLVKAMLASVDAKLPPDPQAELARLDASLKEQTAARAEKAKELAKTRSKRDDYEREVALKESTITTRTTEGWTGTAEGAPGVNRSGPVLVAANGADVRGESTTTIKVDMTAARDALAAMNAGIAGEEGALAGMDAAMQKTAAARQALVKLMGERQTYARQIPALEAAAIDLLEP